VGLTARLCARVAQNPPDTPCADIDLQKCQRELAAPFTLGGGNFRALQRCDAQATAARLQPTLQCAGEKPSPQQLASQLQRPAARP
jgi:hypothetical protein